MYADSSHTLGGNPTTSWIVCPEKWALSTQGILLPSSSLDMSHLIPFDCVAIIRGHEGKRGKTVALIITNIYRMFTMWQALC